jgi:fatty-acyl-CoA synthase
MLAAIAREAEDRVIAVSANLLPLLLSVVADCPLVEVIIVLDGPPPPDLAGQLSGRLMLLEDLLEREGEPVEWGDFDEESAAGLCYTSGTTGPPKGVLYTHRSNYLHTLRALQADAMAITREDVVLAAVPMFHANGWGLPFAAPAAGAKLVLPGRHADGASLTKLIRDEKVTLAVGVQTVWLGVVEHLNASGGELPDLKRILIGGSSCPDSLILLMEQRLGAQVQTSWGMTELSPLGTVPPPGSASGAHGAGRVPVGLDLKLADPEGLALPDQRGAVGHLRVKGPSVVSRYFKSQCDAIDDDGYFDTGDLASIDEDGNLTICGRSKDLIKSGGEWINPTQIEAIIGRDPSVAQVAVIARPDLKWGERPVLIVEPSSGEGVDPLALVRLLRGKVVDWWIPEQVAQVDSMPLAASGKIDKAKLRTDYLAGKLIATLVDS